MKGVQRVVIIGGGFGGLKTALELADNPAFTVTLVSDQPDFRYYPTLYHAATGGRQANASIPLATLLKDRSITFVLGSAESLDRTAKTVTIQEGMQNDRKNDRTLPYDQLVLGLGVVTNYFGITGMEDYSYSIKSLPEALRFKQHIHDQLTQDHVPDQHYAVVGAGPTGIELAGALPSYIRKVMANHGIRHRAIHVDLIEAAPRLLPRLPKATSRKVRKRLQTLGVQLYIGKTVQGLSADELTVSGKPLRSHTVVWTAGVTNHPFFQHNGFRLTPRGKVSVDMCLQAEDNVYVIGDNANTPFSGMAQTALHDGVFIAAHLSRLAADTMPISYPIKRPITVIPVGPEWAAVLWGKARIYGKLGYVLRELGDVAGFKDYEPILEASKQWLTGFGSEENCSVCIAATKTDE